MQRQDDPRSAVEAAALAAIAGIRAQLAANPAQAEAMIAAVEAIVTTHRATSRALVAVLEQGDDPIPYTVEEVAKQLRIGRTLAYQLVARGEIASFSPGGSRLRLITRKALRRYLDEQDARVRDATDPPAPPPLVDDASED